MSPDLNPRYLTGEGGNDDDEGLAILTTHLHTS